MNNNIVIGKHTLESLTSGMYFDPYVVFREYIQNATDSIDEAYKAKVLSHGNDKIEVSVSPLEQMIVIEDNGLGIPAEKAERTLISIGNSQKTSDNARGFRGIGRLSALSYCSKLIFETSFAGESVASRVVIDAKKLSELLTSDIGSNTSVIDVLDKVYTVETNSVPSELHYFKVIMEGVDDSSKLTEYGEILSYISQNVPVPYSPNFNWGKEIVKRLKAEGYYEPKYNVFLTYGDKTIPVYKPYRDEFLVDKNKNITDKILDINIVKLMDSFQHHFAIGWIAKTNYLGSIYDRTVKGIRLRKGNILVGDHQTLNEVFKDARFNGWSIGEIFATDTKLIPNARRDNFEKNPSYFLLVEQLTNIARTITKEIRTASLNRNSDLSKALTQYEKAKRDATSALINGVDGNQKGALAQELSTAQSALNQTVSNGMSDDICKEIAFEELDMLIGSIKGATAYKAINLAKSLTKTEKMILERVFNVISNELGDSSNSLMDAIIHEFTKEETPNDEVLNHKMIE